MKSVVITCDYCQKEIVEQCSDPITIGLFRLHSLQICYGLRDLDAGNETDRSHNMKHDFCSTNCLLNFVKKELKDAPTSA